MQWLAMFMLCSTAACRSRCERVQQMRSYATCKSRFTRPRRAGGHRGPSQVDRPSASSRRKHCGWPELVGGPRPCHRRGDQAQEAQMLQHLSFLSMVTIQIDPSESSGERYHHISQRIHDGYLYTRTEMWVAATRPSRV